MGREKSELFRRLQKMASFLSIDASLYGYRPEQIGIFCQGLIRHQINDEMFGKYS